MIGDSRAAVCVPGTCRRARESEERSPPAESRLRRCAPQDDGARVLGRFAMLESPRWWNRIALIAENWARIRERIARAAARCGRRADEITVVAVSKTHPAEAIVAAYEAGLRHFGRKSRAGVGIETRATRRTSTRTWHMIGHVQSNKARASRSFSIAWIRSIDLALQKNSIPRRTQKRSASRS